RIILIILYIIRILIFLYIYSEGDGVSIFETSPTLYKAEISAGYGLNASSLVECRLCKKEKYIILKVFLSPEFKYDIVFPPSRKITSQDCMDCSNVSRTGVRTFVIRHIPELSLVMSDGRTTTRSKHAGHCFETDVE
ncbi:hypothetical protein L9F63_014897, partial [Diploptera punctata]